MSTNPPPNQKKKTDIHQNLKQLDYTIVNKDTEKGKWICYLPTFLRYTIIRIKESSKRGSLSPNTIDMLGGNSAETLLGIVGCLGRPPRSQRPKMSPVGLNVSWGQQPLRENQHLNGIKTVSMNQSKHQSTTPTRFGVKLQTPRKIGRYARLVAGCTSRKGSGSLGGRGGAKGDLHLVRIIHALHVRARQ